MVAKRNAKSPACISKFLLRLQSRSLCGPDGMMGFGVSGFLRVARRAEDVIQAIGSRYIRSPAQIRRHFDVVPWSNVSPAYYSRLTAATVRFAAQMATIRVMLSGASAFLIAMAIEMLFHGILRFPVRRMRCSVATCSDSYVSRDTTWQIGRYLVLGLGAGSNHRERRSNTQGEYGVTRAMGHGPFTRAEP
jgi:hypothetical protein